MRILCRFEIAFNHTEQKEVVRLDQSQKARTWYLLELVETVINTPVRFAKKLSQNTVPTDLRREKNTVPAEKIN